MDEAQLQRIPGNRPRCPRISLDFARDSLMKRLRAYARNYFDGGRVFLCLPIFQNMEHRIFRDAPRADIVLR
jgi:hypothetical protein